MDIKRERLQIRNRERVISQSRRDRLPEATHPQRPARRIDREHYTALPRTCPRIRSRMAKASQHEDTSCGETQREQKLGACRNEVCMPCFEASSAWIGRGIVDGHDLSLRVQLHDSRAHAGCFTTAADPISSIALVIAARRRRDGRRSRGTPWRRSRCCQSRSRTLMRLSSVLPSPSFRPKSTAPL